MLDALRRIAPGTTMRQGLNDILRARLGALIVIGEPAELSFMFSGGIRLDQAFSPYLLYELAKMDGAIILNAVATRIVYANVQLMPDPTIPSAETGTRHRTAERVAKQTGAFVISISQQRDVVTTYVGDVRYQLEAISDILAKTNQAVTTLETYRTRFEQVSTRLTALEFQGAVMLDDVLVALQRAEMTSRMRDEIERNIAELGVERSEEHTSELQSPVHLVCRLLLEKKKKKNTVHNKNKKKTFKIKKKKKEYDKFNRNKKSLIKYSVNHSRFNCHYNLKP